MSIKYHSVDPESIKPYRANDVADFIINTDRNIVNGSVRLTGVLSITKGGNKVSGAEDQGDCVYYNPNTGIHGAFSSISVSNGSTLEFLDNYPRFVNMVEKSSKDINDYFSTADIVELKVPNENHALSISAGVTYLIPNGAQSGNKELVDFSMKPLICLNRMMNTNSLNLGAMNNRIKVSFTMATDNNFLIGGDMANDCTYELTELKLTYRTVEPSPTPNVLCRSYASTKLQLDNGNESVSTRKPVVASGVSVSFLEVFKENNNTLNSYCLDRPPNVKRVQFSFNNNTSEFISYEMTSQIEMRERYLESMKSGGVNQVNPQKARGSDGYGLGASFDSFVDLTQNKITFDLESNIQNNNKYNVFLYFHSQLEL